MSQERPLWLLDVDGVLNANRPGWSAAPLSRLAYIDGVGWRMRWSPALMARIRELLDRVEVRWATSWVGETAQLEALFGLPSLTLAYPDPRPLPDPGISPHADLKLGAALEALAAGRRLIWTDDDAIPRWMPADSGLADRALLITPRPNRGLQPEHLDRIEAFLSAPSGFGPGPQRGPGGIGSGRTGRT